MYIGDVIFKCHNEKQHFNDQYSKNILNVRQLLVTIFKEGYENTKYRHIHKSLEEAQNRGGILIGGNML
jgi:hypothetical protein